MIIILLKAVSVRRYNESMWVISEFLEAPSLASYRIHNKTYKNSLISWQRSYYAFRKRIIPDILLPKRTTAVLGLMTHPHITIVDSYWWLIQVLNELSPRLRSLVSIGESARRWLWNTFSQLFAEHRELLEIKRVYSWFLFA